MIDENNHWLNQLALPKLKEVGAEADPNYHYFLQLAEWASQNGKLEFNPKLEDALKENLEALLYDWEKENVLPWFLDLEEDGAEESVPKWAEKSPEHLAAWVFDQLDSRLSASLDGYPPNSGNPVIFR